MPRINFGLANYFQNPKDYDGQGLPAGASRAACNNKLIFIQKAVRLQAYEAAFINHDPEMSRIYNAQFSKGEDISVQEQLYKKLVIAPIYAEHAEFSKPLVQNIGLLVQPNALFSSGNNELSAIEQLKFKFEDLATLKKILQDLNAGKKITSLPEKPDKKAGAGKQLQYQIAKLNLEQPANSAQRDYFIARLQEKVDSGMRMQALGAGETFENVDKVLSNRLGKHFDKNNGADPVKAAITIAGFTPTTKQVIDALKDLYKQHEMCARILVKQEANEKKFTVAIRRIFWLKDIQKVFQNGNYDAFSALGSDAVTYANEILGLNLNSGSYDESRKQEALKALATEIAKQERAILNDPSYQHFDEDELAYLESDVRENQAYINAKPADRERMIAESKQHLGLLTKSEVQKTNRMLNSAATELQKNSKSPVEPAGILQRAYPGFNIPVIWGDTLEDTINPKTKKPYSLDDFYDTRRGKYIDIRGNGRPFAEPFAKFNGGIFYKNRHRLNPLNYLLYAAEILDRSVDYAYYNMFNDRFNDKFGVLPDWGQNIIRAVAGVAFAFASFITSTILFAVKAIVNPKSIPSMIAETAKSVGRNLRSLIPWSRENNSVAGQYLKLRDARLTKEGPTKDSAALSRQQSIDASRRKSAVELSHLHRPPSRTSLYTPDPVIQMTSPEESPAASTVGNDSDSPTAGGSSSRLDESPERGDSPRVVNLRAGETTAEAAQRAATSSNNQGQNDPDTDPNADSDTPRPDR